MTKAQLFEESLWWHLRLVQSSSVQLHEWQLRLAAGGVESVIQSLNQWPTLSPALQGELAALFCDMGRWAHSMFGSCVVKRDTGLANKQWTLHESCCIQTEDKEKCRWRSWPSSTGCKNVISGNIFILMDKWYNRGSSTLSPEHRKLIWWRYSFNRSFWNYKLQPQEAKFCETPPWETYL